jgi:hypothetical protein
MKKVIDSGNLQVSYAPYTYFLNLLKNKQQFNYTRVQHGICDVLIESYSNVNDLINDIRTQKWGIIASNVIQSNNRVLEVWHKTDKSILNELASAYKIIYENDALIPNLHLGVSTGIGFGKNSFGNLAETNQMQKNRALVMQVLTERANTIYHGGLPRHMSIMDETFDFFNSLNEMNVDVVIYGPIYMKKYAEVFNIRRFHHLTISPSGAIGEIDSVFPKLINYCNKLDNPLILNCSGHIISLLLAYNLRNTNISSFDIGLGFNWYIKEYLKIHYPEIKNPWLKQPKNKLKQHVLNIRK